MWKPIPALVRRLALGAGLLAVPVASAEPMDLSNAKARWVAVSFEVSPEDRPDQVRDRFSRRFMARLEPAEDPRVVRVRVAAPIVEQHLFLGQQPSPGSFSDFVWTFDRVTGHVLSATTSGVLLREVGWGMARWRADAAVVVAMDTLAAVGFQQSRLMGEAYPRLCPQPDNRGCTVVYPSRYDGQTGYVNAVGQVTARSAGIEVRSFSPLGEAIFSELGDPFDAIWSQAGDGLRAGAAAPAPAP